MKPFIFYSICLFNFKTVYGLEHVFVISRGKVAVSGGSAEARAAYVCIRPGANSYCRCRGRGDPLPSARALVTGGGGEGAWGRRWKHSSSSSTTSYCGRWMHYSSVTWRAYLRPEGSIVVCGRTPQGLMSHEFPLWPGQMVTIVLAVACVRL